MNENLNTGRQKLGVLLDSSVDSETRHWITSMAPDSMIRDADVDWPVNDVNFKNLINQLVTGEIDVAIFFTAAGLNQFFDRAVRTIDRDRLVHSLQDIQTIAVGDLTAKALKDLGVEAAMSLDSGLGWRDILVGLDQEYPVGNLSLVLESRRMWLRSSLVWKLVVRLSNTCRLFLLSVWTPVPRNRISSTRLRMVVWAAFCFPTR